MSDPIDLKELARIPQMCPGYRVRVAERLTTRFFNARFKEAGLSSVQFGLLVGIETSDRPMVADLADLSGADPSTLARNMKALEELGLVVSVGGRGRFGKRFELSEMGRSSLRRAFAIWQTAYQDVLSDMRLDEVQQGLSFLTSLEESARDKAGGEPADQLPVRPEAMSSGRAGRDHPR